MKIYTEKIKEDKDKILKPEANNLPQQVSYSHDQQDFKYVRFGYVVGESKFKFNREKENLSFNLDLQDMSSIKGINLQLSCLPTLLNIKVIGSLSVMPIKTVRTYLKILLPVISLLRQASLQERLHWIWNLIVKRLKNQWG